MPSKKQPVIELAQEKILVRELLKAGLLTPAQAACFAEPEFRFRMSIAARRKIFSTVTSWRGRIDAGVISDKELRAFLRETRNALYGFFKVRADCRHFVPAQLLFDLMLKSRGIHGQAADWLKCIYALMFAQAYGSSRRLSGRL